MQIKDFLHTSLLAIPLIALISAIRFFMVYRLPKKTFRVLWCIALCCLFIPYNLVPHLISGFIGKLPKAEVLAGPADTNTPPAKTAADATPEAAENMAPSVFSNISDIYDTVDRFGKDVFSRIDMIGATGANSSIAGQTGEKPGSGIVPLLSIWLFGALICAAYFAFSHIRFQRQCARSLPVDDGFARSWQLEMREVKRRKVKIRQSELIVSPLTYGIFRPVILLPKTTDYGDKNKLEYILQHEYAHIRRFDTLAKLFLAAALCAHWFNPLVWLMYVLANRDIELSCDEIVVKKIKSAENTKFDYALTLIALEEKKRLLAAGSYFSKNIMKERIKSIMKLKKASAARILLAAMLVSMVGALFFTLQSCEGDKNSKDPFEMQEQTDKLVVYSYISNERILAAALNIFREKYPDVKIEHRSFDNEDFMASINEYTKTLRTELAAGKGPDLIISSGSEFDDVYKSMDSGIFLELDPFLENDDEFIMDDYVKAVLDSGVYKGKRYIMPLEYKVPVMLTTKEILDAESISPSDLATFDGFIEALEAYNEKYGGNAEKSIFKKYPWDDTFIANAFPWCGIKPIDYSTGKSGVDNPHFKSVLEIVKSSYVNQAEAEAIYSEGPGQNIQSFQNQKILFDAIGISSNSIMFYDNYSLLLEKKLTPVFLRYPGIDNKLVAKANKFAAMPKASQNQVNAYNLLKIIMSDDIQSMMYLLETPVKKSAVRATGENQVYGYGDVLGLYYPMPEDKFEEYINLLLGVDSCELMSGAAYNDFLRNDMLPYFEGKKPFEDCAKILKNNLELYMSE